MESRISYSVHEKRRVGARAKKMDEEINAFIA